MNPWMGALEDNLDVLNKTDDAAGEWGRAATRDLIRSRIKVKSLNFMRGRTFLNKFLVIDEAAESHAQTDENADHARPGPAPRWCAWATSRRSTHPISPKAVQASPMWWIA